MTLEPTPTLQRLGELPRSDRRDALTALVVAEFKAALLMGDAEELALQESYFALGFTSLRVTEIKQRLEQLLGVGLSANVLFGQPTVEHLVDHLVDDVLVDLFTADEAPAPA
ncbi:MAG TPA: acyl carrier protein, partial [Pseudonocardiaceae bacterium]